MGMDNIIHFPHLHFQTSGTNCLFAKTSLNYSQPLYHGGQIKGTQKLYLELTRNFSLHWHIFIFSHETQIQQFFCTSVLCLAYLTYLQLFVNRHFATFFTVADHAGNLQRSALSSNNYIVHFFLALAITDCCDKHNLSLKEGVNLYLIFSMLLYLPLEKSRNIFHIDKIKQNSLQMDSVFQMTAL